MIPVRFPCQRLADEGAEEMNMMYRTILVPLDGSEFAEEALPLAKAIASQVGAELHLAHVIVSSPDVDFKTPQDDLAWRERAREGSGGYLKGHATAAEGEGISTLTAVLEGRVVPTLIEYAQEQDVDLIALTSHGHGGVRRWWLGSVADGLLRTGAVDLLLVRPWDDTEDRPRTESRFRRIVVALDGSQPAEAALPAAVQLATAFGADVLALRVVPKPLELTSIYGVPGVRMSGEGHEERMEEAREYLHAVAEGDHGTPLEAHVFESPGAADGIVEGASQLDADLVVISTRGHDEMTRLVIGSVADKVIRGTTRPVLVVRVPDED
ncbi:MAG: universal stress protein [Gemmatimonadota bacterium]